MRDTAALCQAAKGGDGSPCVYTERDAETACRATSDTAAQCSRSSQNGHLGAETVVPSVLNCIFNLKKNAVCDTGTCAWTNVGTEPAATCVSFNDNQSGCEGAGAGDNACTWNACEFSGVYVPGAHMKRAPTRRGGFESFS